MSKLNPKAKNPHRGTGVSFNGNKQDLKQSEQNLYDIIVTTLFGKDSYYETNDERLTRLDKAVSEVVAKGNLDFVANAIIHARTVMHIRSMPVILTVLFAKSLRAQNKSYENMRRLTRDVIQRADQITDMFAYASSVFGSGQKIPMAIKRGLGDAFNKFGEYAFAKYNRNGSTKFTDVMRIVHPVPTNNTQGVIFDKLMNEARQEAQKTSNGTLSVPYTWETQLSDAGKTGKSKAKVWEELIQSGKLGYMALLRNLRNLKEAGVSSDVMKTVYERIADPAQVAKSKQLPFRFVNAYEAVQQQRDAKLQRAISRAMDASLSNIPQIGENVWIVVDVSHSMSGFGWGSRNSQGQTPIQTATLLAAALAKANAEADNVQVTLFSDRAHHASINTDDSVMSITEKLRSEVYGGGTNLQAALDELKNLSFKPDTVIVLSDMQVNNLRGSRTVASYFDNSVIKVAINLEGYDSTPVGVLDGWYQLSGFSERMFDFIPAIRNKQSVTKLLSVPYIGPDGFKELHGM